MGRNNRIGRAIKCKFCGCIFRGKAGMSPGRGYCNRDCYSKSQIIDFSYRFWIAVQKTTTCWLWVGTTNPGGYGTLTGPFGVNGKPKPEAAHRVSWRIHNGPIPEGLRVLHKCDVRNCVRPDHLFLGTNTDNMQDMVKKGRSTFGARNVNAKLTDDMVREIRRIYKPGPNSKSKQIAERYGIDRSALWAIITRKTWKHVQ